MRLKRDLWDGLLREAYGEDVGDDSLFLQHTYLTIVVKAIAARVLDLPVHDAVSLLSGRALADEGILGAVEADFFDWPLKRTAGAELVRHVAMQTARFRLRDVEADVLKILYESLVDPDERHDLGEYYTPDWLAARIVATAVDSPLQQRVLDPACGSGTFLFHAVRRLIAAGRAVGWPGPRILQACAEKVRGLDVHPVAVTLARVTWLLALGDLVTDRPAKLTVPVFLGDAMQWNLRQYVGGADVLVPVPGEERPLQIPAGFAEDQAVFEQGLDALNQGLADGATPESVGRALRRIEGAAAADADALAGTFGHLQALYRAGRNGIWTFVFRNLVRPVWLSRPEQRADVLVGNPPWIVYRHLSAEMKERLREALRAYELWVGGNLATQQDMCALFWARGAERYLGPGGRLAFVLPYAVLNAPVFAGLRTGRLGARGAADRRLGAGRVWPIFGAQSGSSTTSTCVLFGRRGHSGDASGEGGSLGRSSAPAGRRRRGGDEALKLHPMATRPNIGRCFAVSNHFRQGATLDPRRFFIVEPEPIGRLGGRRDAPRMRGQSGSLDKRPWSSVDAPSGPVEIQFLRRTALGETIAPFRLLQAATAIGPLEGSRLLNSLSAGEAGHRHLSAWMRDVEAKWAAHSARDANGALRTTLVENIDHMRKLTCQAGRAALRVLYTASGTRLSAASMVANDNLSVSRRVLGDSSQRQRGGLLVVGD